MRNSDEHRWSTLMVSAQAGDSSDYRQLLKELAGVIQKFLRSRFGAHEFLDDCVQEALIAVHQARHTYDPKRPFRPWLFAIVRNKAIDFLRGQQTRARTQEHYQNEQEVLSQPDSHADRHEADSLGYLLGMLSDPHREVLVLTKVMGFSIAESAEKLDISQSAVKVRVHRAIRKLQRLLENETV